MSKQQNKSKANALKAIMGNSKLAEDVFAGQTAPYGSTKRKVASSILSSVHTGMAADGLGGSGSTYQSLLPPVPSSQLQPAPTLGASVPNNLPKPPIQIAPTLDSILKLNKEGKVDMPQSNQSAQPGADQFSSTKSYAELLSAVNQYQNPRSQFSFSNQGVQVNPNGISLSQAGKATAAQPGLSLPGDSSQGGQRGSVVPDLGIAMPGNLQPPPPGLSGSQKPGDVPKANEPTKYTYQDANTFYSACMNSSVADTEGKTQHEYCYVQAKNKTGKTPTVSSVGQFSPDDLGPTASDTSPIDLQDMLDYAAATGDYSELDAWYNELRKTNPEMADQIAPQMDATIKALAQGMTQAEFQANMLLNPKALASALGVPEEVMESFSFDLFGGEKAEDLQEIARQKYQMNQWEAALADRTTAHLNSSIEFKNYIRGKDQYLGKLDEMLYNLGEQRKNIDMSDPEMAKRYSNYQNYLVGLKGAQSKRYIDMLNDSLEMEQNDYDRFLSLYETKVQQVSDFVTQQLDQQDIDQQRAQRLLPFITESLDGIYRAANGIDDIEEEKNRLEMSKIMESANIIKTLSDLNFDPDKLREVAPELAKYADAMLPEGTELLSGGDKDFTETKYNSIVRVDENDGKITSVEVFGIRDLIEMGKSLELKNIEHLTDRYGRDVAMVLEKEVSENGNLDAALEPYIKALENDTDLDETEYAVAEKYLDRIVSGAQKGMRQHLIDYQSGTMKTIMTKMLNGKIKSKEDLVSKYEDKIDPYLLETLWAVDEALRQEIFDGSPGIFESLDEVPHFGIDKSEWQTLLSDPEAMASYFLGEI